MHKLCIQESAKIYVNDGHSTTATCLCQKCSISISLKYVSMVINQTLEYIAMVVNCLMYVSISKTCISGGYSRIILNLYQ